MGFKILKIDSNKNKKLLWFCILILAFLTTIILVSAIWLVIDEDGLFKTLGMPKNEYNIIADWLEKFAENLFKAVFGLVFRIILAPFLFILSVSQKIIRFLSGEQIIKSLFFSNSKTSSPSKWYTVVLTISFSFLVILIILKMVSLLGKNKSQSKALSNSFKNLFISLIAIVLTPIIFLTLNTIIFDLISIVFDIAEFKDDNIALIIFNSSFSDGVKQFKEIPSDPFFHGWEEFNPLICLFSTAVIAWVLLMTNIKLFWILGQLFVYFVISPFAILSSFSDEGKRFHEWKDLVIGHFFTYWLVFLFFGIFLSAQPVLIKFSKTVNDAAASGIIYIISTLSFAFLMPNADSVLSFLFKSRESTVEQQSSAAAQNFSSKMGGAALGALSLGGAGIKNSAVFAGKKMFGIKSASNEDKSGASSGIGKVIKPIAKASTPNHDTVKKFETSFGSGMGAKKNGK